jgi:quinoprotein glucose dehydrogenase
LRRVARPGRRRHAAPARARPGRVGGPRRRAARDRARGAVEDRAGRCAAAGRARAARRRAARAAHGLRLLGALADPAATPALGAQLDKLLAGLFPVELSFDLVSAARARKDPGLDAKLAALERSRALDPTLAPWIETLFGGQQEAGKGVFREKSETSCLRCHKTEWDEGGDVGPDLRGIGKRLSRLQILESILQPNRHVDPGYRNTLFALQDERVVEARILLEDEVKFRVLDANAKTFDLPKSEVESHKDGLSAMPEGLEKFLTPREMRDLIEYLCSI